MKRNIEKRMKQKRKTWRKSLSYICCIVRKFKDAFGSGSQEYFSQKHKTPS